MNQPRAIFRNTVALTIADLVNRGGGIVLSLLISRTLFATGLGIYSAALAYYNLIALAGGMGAQDFLVREIARERSRTSYYVVHAGLLGVAGALVAMGVFLLLLPYLGYSTELTASMYVVILAVIPGTLNTIQNAVFVAHQRVEFILYTRFVATLLYVGLSLYVLLNGHGVVSLLVAFVIVEYLVMVSLFVWINRFIAPLRWEFRLADAGRLLWEMRAFAALSILSGIFTQPEVIVLSLLQSEAEVGFYSAALKLVGFWYFISQIFMTNVYPVLSRFYQVEEARFQVIQDKSIKYLLALSLPITAGIVAAAGPIIRLFFGPGFEAAVTPLQILAWNIPLAFVSAVLWRVLAARNQQNSVLWVRIVTLFTRLGGAYFLTRWWATIGAAISAPANFLLNALLLALAIRRDGIRLRLVGLGWRFALAALAMGVLTWLLSPHLSLWLLVPLAVVVYGVLALLLRAFAADDWALLLQVWQIRAATKQGAQE